MPQLRPADSETLGVGPAVLDSPAGGSQAGYSLRATGLRAGAEVEVGRGSPFHLSGREPSC